jgi:hypothetical protein
VEAKVVERMGFTLEEDIMGLANYMQKLRGGCVDTDGFVGVAG